MKEVDEVKAFLDSGKDVNTGEQYGDTLLHYSANDGNFKVPFLLLFFIQLYRICLFIIFYFLSFKIMSM